MAFNEISQRVNPDWVEFYNNGSEPVDLSGWMFQDEKDRDSEDYVFPDGTVLDAGEYLVLDAADGDVPGFEFGLGKADVVRLSDSSGALVDTFAWDAHALTTYGRCPDGTGDFQLTAASTKGGVNDCTSPARINEISSEWVEIINPTDADLDLGAHVLRGAGAADGYEIPAGTVLEPATFVVIDQDDLGFDLDTADGVELIDASGAVADEHGWEALPETSQGRCPDGTGDFEVTALATPGAANDCVPAGGQDTLRVNEVESSGGDPGDWVELMNTGSEDVDLSGWLLRDDDDTHTSTIPEGTVIEAGGYYIHERDQLGFGLGGSDMVRLYAPNGNLVDATEWDGHAPTTYGRCPDGSGEFQVTGSVTKGAANDCGDPDGPDDPDEPGEPWPGSPDVATVDPAETFDGDLSGLDYQPTGTMEPAVMWAVDNGRGRLHRLEWNGSVWDNSSADGWSAGKTLRYRDGSGTPDSEGVTVTGDGDVVVGTERDNDNGSVSRLSLLRYEITGTETELVAAAEWDLTADLPPVRANAGVEAVKWVPDTTLTELGFIDESTGDVYDPANYSGHDGGVYFVGIEGSGLVYGYVLVADGDFQQVAEIDPGLDGVMGLEYEHETSTLWVVCDNGCEGRSALLRVSDDGTFELAEHVERPADMPDLNNEGFAMTPAVQCVEGMRPVYWADDGDTDEHSLRAGTLPCIDEPDPDDPPDEENPPGGTEDGGAEDGGTEDGGAEDGDGTDDGQGDDSGGEGGADGDGTDTGTDDGQGDDTGTEGGEDPGLPDTGGVSDLLVIGGALVMLAGIALLIGTRRSNQLNAGQAA
ncbi:lamin tail domain-containing protein [Phytoactinopolyspora endophytica]|uniref:lamin tail domain-containing protein n=1 Tax=Phytoactinopolyspora endophytica TaxID=1642495 RepID=UPI0013EC444E|nr:lamin tail domain-containing protein [Phytoactinopolyspora endophytica]